MASSFDLLPNQADLWDSNAVPSSQSVWINYEGKPLNSKQKVFWQVQYTDDKGRLSLWSEVAFFEMGLLESSDWQAKWISLPPEEEETTTQGWSAYKPEYLRKDFTLTDELFEARLYITSKGLFEAQINGKKIGQDVMTPGFTPYQKRVETLSYDATELLQKGENTIGILLGEGWYSGRLGWEKDWSRKYLPKAICQLELTYIDGKKKPLLPILVGRAQETVLFGFQEFMTVKIMMLITN